MSATPCPMFLGKSYIQSKSGAMSVPTPGSISYMWNFGSLLGLFLTIQLVSGFTLSLFYKSSLEEAFDSVIYISEEISFGWLLRSAHANGASFFFILVFAHIGRGLLYKSFGKSKITWSVGVLILLSLMGTAFLGYVLPWGQMSFWGATVITNLLSTLPKGGEIVVWVWGGFTVGGPTLSRFYSFHYILPFVVAALSVTHIVSLHDKGSSNPLGVSKDVDKIFFHPLFTVKDLVGVMVLFLLFMSVVILSPDLFMDPDNFTQANSMVTPAHIQPEWYFLFAYAILRSIPSKLGGVVALVGSVAILLILPMLHSGVSVSKVGEMVFWLLVGTFFLLTWIGSMPVEGPIVLAGQVLSAVYFILVILASII